MNKIPNIIWKLREKPTDKEKRLLIESKTVFELREK